jgi:hypothetical protein
VYTIPQLLGAARVSFQPFPNVAGVYLTAANQLIGTYKDLCSFRDRTPTYKGWEVHHIVEDQDLDRLGVRNTQPIYNLQVCVLIPESAHQKRVNSIFRNQNPSSLTANLQQLRSAYNDAYALMGDYCGGGEFGVRNELLNIFKAVMRSSGLPA